MSLKVKSFILSIAFIPLAIIGQILGKVISSFSCNLLSIPGVIYITSIIAGITGGWLAALTMNNFDEFDKKILLIFPVLFFVIQAGSFVYFGLFEGFFSHPRYIMGVLQSTLTIILFLKMIRDGSSIHP